MMRDDIDVNEKVKMLVEGTSGVDPFSSSRDIFVFRDFNKSSETPSIYLFPKYSFINQREYYYHTYNKWLTKNMINLHFRK